MAETKYTLSVVRARANPAVGIQEDFVTVKLSDDNRTSYGAWLPLSASLEDVNDMMTGIAIELLAPVVCKELGHDS